MRRRQQVCQIFIALSTLGRTHKSLSGIILTINLEKLFFSTSLNP